MMSTRFSSKTVIALCTTACLFSSCRSQGSEPQGEDAPHKNQEPENEPEGQSTAEGDTGSSSEVESPVARKPVVLRRLNRVEYDGTLKALLGQDFGLSKDFPSEDPSLGFDNIAEALSLSPLQVELYERAAQVVVDRLVTPPAPDLLSKHWEAETLKASVGAACCEGFWNLYSEGSLEASVTIEKAGRYAVDIRSYGDQMGDEAAKLRFEVDDDVIGEWEVKSVKEAPEVLELKIDLAPGEHKLRIWFTNDAYDPVTKSDRNLLIDWLSLEGPLDGVATPNPELARLLDCKGPDERSCYENWVEEFGLKAWRRPLSEEESQTLKGLYQGRALHHAVSRALSTFLLSPHFLFRVELDPEPESPSSRALNDYELATRLSYFLWSRSPDERLLELAGEGKLVEDRVLRAEVERMLSDPKASALVNNFAGQWLSIRALGDLSKDAKTYPGFSPSLVQAMRKEQELFFSSFLREDRPMTELLTSEDTYANKELAEFYGLDSKEVPADAHVEVSLKQSARRGLLGQAGLMAVLAHPETSAPVLRGKWVLEHLLCVEPPPPPADVEIPPVKPSENQTMREQLAKHREDPTCASCHELMDPIGLALENFDGIGRWRDRENGRLIDASGKLPKGSTLHGPKELAEAIAEHPAFLPCSVRKTLIYALGRDLGGDDEGDLDTIVSLVRDSGLSFRALLREIVMSPIFRRRG